MCSIYIIGNLSGCLFDYTYLNNKIFQTLFQNKRLFS